MAQDASGLDPVARVSENRGDLYAALDQIVDEWECERYVFAYEVGGSTWLCKWNDEDPHWSTTGVFSEGPAGGWDVETDNLDDELPEGYKVVDVIRGSRYLVHGGN